MPHGTSCPGSGPRRNWQRDRGRSGRVWFRAHQTWFSTRTKQGGGASGGTPHRPRRSRRTAPFLRNDGARYSRDHLPPPRLVGADTTFAMHRALRNRGAGWYPATQVGPGSGSQPSSFSSRSLYVRLLVGLGRGRHRSASTSGTRLVRLHQTDSGEPKGVEDNEGCDPRRLLRHTQDVGVLR